MSVSLSLGLILGFIFTLFFTLIMDMVFQPILNWAFDSGIENEVNTNFIIFMVIVWLISSNVITAFIVKEQKGN